MKPDERALEKQVKRILRGEPADATAVEFHLRGLGRSGEYSIIRLLNRLAGWTSFIRWAAQYPETQGLVQKLTDLPGISQAGIDAMRAEGEEKGTRADAALRMLKQIEAGPGDWEKLQKELRDDLDLFEGLLILLESSNSDSAPEFMQFLLDQGFSREQDGKIRKVLYQFRQKGIRPEIKSQETQQARELFLFGENKLPLWQPVLYFRPHSAYSGTGDLLVLRILEGSECSPPEQQRNLALDQVAMDHLAERYSDQLAKQLGLQIKFHSVSSAVSRYLLRISAELILEPSRRKPLEDFLKFVGSESAENPFEAIQEIDSGEMISADILIRESYFSHWILNPHELEEYLNQLSSLEKGPIILTGAPLLARKQELRIDALRKVFSNTRIVWTFAFKKAAFYLQKSNTTASGTAMYFAKKLENPEVAIEDVGVAHVLFDRTLEMVQKQQKAKEEEERKSSLIVTPDEFRKKMRDA